MSLDYCFDTSLISNTQIRKSSSDEDKNECGETNEAKRTSKSCYQICLTGTEWDANVIVSQPPATLEDRPTALIQAKSVAPTSQKTNPLFSNYVRGWPGIATDVMRGIWAYQDSEKDVSIYKTSTNLFQNKMVINSDTIRLPCFIGKV